MKFIFILILWTQACHTTTDLPQNSQTTATENRTTSRFEKITKSDEEWKKELSPEAYYILRQKGTERAFTGEYWDNKSTGIYTCAACDLDLFDSNTKFKSGTGWPSFYEPLQEDHITEDVDYNIGYKRTEVLCARCGGHLGHVFEDGPKPTGLRYCINSAALKFNPKSEVESKKE